MSKTPSTFDEQLDDLICKNLQLNGIRGPAIVQTMDLIEAIKQLVAREVIGRDETQTENGLLPDRVDRRNQLRSEQRKALGIETKETK